MIFPEKLALPSEIYSCLIVGTGAAAYNAALHLYEKDVRNIAIISENRLAGTSRNTGSDKQTYYKMASTGDQKDSPLAMAQTLFSGGGMDGDLALCEASHSLEEFFHLVSIGVEFPHNRYGYYAAYKTDHDPSQRASSIGPYTSKKMTEKLEEACLLRKIKLIDKTRAIKVLTEKNRACGLLCLNEKIEYKVFFADNIIFASGGPAGLYAQTVYPQSQFGSSGILAREGVVFANIAEWQYGIGSTKFRWNLSGSYQQVIPRYLSVDDDGNEHEFLSEWFSSPEKAFEAVFLKGYQWPFDPSRLANDGSSIVDIAVYCEKYIKGRKVFLDFMRNPKGFVLDKLDKTSKDYLFNSNALLDSPLERLLSLNPLSYGLYKDHGIDLAVEYLEIDVMPQHNNGGAEVNIWWETSVRNLFAIGECAGTHGIKRPGGSALNAGQVGGLRAASYIAYRHHSGKDFFTIEKLKEIAEENLKEFNGQVKSFFSAGNMGETESAADALAQLQLTNTKNMMFLRSKKEIEKSSDCISALQKCKFSPEDNTDTFYRFWEMLLYSRLLHDAALYYIEAGGKSRGSYLIADSLDGIAEIGRYTEIDDKHSDLIVNTVYDKEQNSVSSSMRKVRPIPGPETWFENVWKEFREGTIYGLD